MSGRMSAKFFPNTLVLFVLLLVGLPASAETLRCDGHIIEMGTPQEEVLQHCGQPDETNNQVHRTWTYRQHHGGKDVIIYFYANGDVERIESVRP